MNDLDRMRGVVLAVVIGVVGAAWLVTYWSM